MRTPASFGGALGRRAYAACALPVVFSQHVFTALAIGATGGRPQAPWWFWLDPMRELMFPPHHLSPLHDLAAWVLPAGMALTLLADALLAALSFRRARDARAYFWIAAFTVAPGLQAVAVLWLSLAPRRPEPAALHSGPGGKSTPQDAVVGVLTGASLCLGAAVVATLVLHDYGWGLFLASPFVIGFVTAFLTNRHGDRGAGRSITLVLYALALGALGLLGFALEGVVCLILASPLILAMGVVGGLAGRAVALQASRRRGTAVMSVAILPLVLMGEIVLPPRAGFDSVESVEVAAPPAAVWSAITHMGPIPEPPAAPFRWGLAYPVRGEILGTGVGALRRGVFSTGVAYERVTEWSPERRLSFIVLSDPPTMTELSPYPHVNAPHDLGYFRTLDARFTIAPLADGKTRLALATRHELDLEPALYWLPIAQWATHVNKMRVLDHFRRQAEALGG